MSSDRGAGQAAVGRYLPSPLLDKPAHRPILQRLKLGYALLAAGISAEIGGDIRLLGGRICETWMQQNLDRARSQRREPGKTAGESRGAHVTGVREPDEVVVRPDAQALGGLTVLGREPIEQHVFQQVDRIPDA